MTNAHKVQLFHDAATFMKIFAGIMAVVLSYRVDLIFVMQYILYQIVKAARYVHLLLAGPG